MQNFQLYEHASTFPEKSYTRGSWQQGYQSLKQEFDYWISDVEGQIPPELHGTLFRNGPGLLDVNGHRIHHPFDGDGMISRITFSNSRAHFSNRFIRTIGYLEEQKAGKILYRGVFGTQKPGGWLANAFDLKFKNIANTNVIYWGDKLLALWEAAEPHRLDPYTLETLGKEYFKGVLSEGEAFAAHPRFDPSGSINGGEPCLVNFSIKPGLSSTITIFELDLTGAIVRKQAHSVPGFTFIHDFAITPNYCILFQNPVAFNPIPFVAGMRGAGECIKFQPNQKTRIVVINRNPDKKGVQILETHSGFVFHHANAFEVDDEIVIDSICYESFPEVKPESDFREVDFDALKPGQLWRFHVKLNEPPVWRELLENRCCEFPCIHPSKVGRPYRYLYMGAAHAETGNAPLQAFLKVDLELQERQFWSAAPHGFVSEPIFVPRPGSEKEDDGWLLGLVYDSTHHRSDVVILDANNLNLGAVARLHLKHHIPYGLHGNFTSEVFVP
ncbi:carotenoid oxygenase family protein [Aetokthonos hydrillicola Thurmond2011]|jgi:all-trans-8'-apo-beta-carotenal 15,15'-oxygenase|uniref:Carotenoid oxygenase family protein n=1 Tax=Aetokthonos hydrillicola Thurmond2011 TaxID=2712845 RepID=A0AAP5M7U3_9CYAN|nr:carotenoid oxygenase family protein [Aetokthonos hydrillicola]MBO3462922.1 carotenoid oxygenase family protein [Aetokthonos hydrillicola CCALA 1050]MBW4584270.1 carotenoid oxygenase family protein [Aetokthonos hydrillicola CCALA 1050]MDR9898521.1 carotenoid oxygenase family protein [Aetokthonos hydrillicola Thurmond2011]